MKRTEKLQIYRDLRKQICQAERLMMSCRICPHKCGVNRLEGERGVCESLASTNYFDSVTHYGDELEITPNYAISFNGCNLRCVYCITAEESYHGNLGTPFDVFEFVMMMEEHYKNGVTKLHLLGGEPGIHLSTILTLAQYIRPEIKIILNSNFYFSKKVLSILSGIVTYYLVDLKYGNNKCAYSCSRVKDYWKVVTKNILTARSMGRLIIRHLLIPGHLDCCALPVMDWVAGNCPDIAFSMGDHFIFTGAHPENPEFGRYVSKEESARAFEAARKRELNLISWLPGNQTEQKDIEIWISPDGKVYFRNVTKDVLEISQKLDPDNKEIVKRCMILNNFGKKDYIK